MKKLLLFSLAFTLMHSSILLCDNIKNMKIELISSENLDEERQFFIKQWMSAWNRYSLDQLGISHISQYLNALFNKEEQAYAERNSNQLFYHAIVGNRVVAYISYDIDENLIATVRQAVVSDELLGDIDNLREFYFAVLNHIPDVAEIRVIFYSEKELAANFNQILEKLGFELISNQDNDSDIWACYSLFCADRCATCYCGCDDEDLAFELLSCSHSDEERSIDGALSLEYNYREKEE